MDKTFELLNTAPVEWQTIFAGMSKDERMAMMSDLSALMERGARLKGYMEGRYLYSERPHEAGVIASNKLAARVRKLLGFAYPKQDLSF